MNKIIGRIMAMMLSASMLATPLMSATAVYAEELEVLEQTNENDADELVSFDTEKETFSESGADDIEALTDDEFETDMFQSSNGDFSEAFDESDVLSGYSSDTEEYDASYEDEMSGAAGIGKANGAGIKKSAQDVFKKMGGKKSGKNSYMYRQLSKKEKTIYNKINSEVTRLLYNGKAPRKIKGRGSERFTNEFYTEKFKTGGKQSETFDKVYNIYLLDNPQAFILSDDNLTGTRKRTFYCLARVNSDTNTAKKIKNRAEEIAKNIKADAAKVKKQKGDYKKVYKILEILCKRLEQGNGYLDGFTGLHTTYYKKRTVGNDRSYAIAFVALARLSGLEAYHISGDWENQFVGDWVRVKVGGKWYNVDPKKCDNMLEEEDFKRGYSLKFFLKNDKDINCDKEHIVESRFKKYYPKTNSKSYNLPSK